MLATTPSPRESPTSARRRSVHQIDCRYPGEVGVPRRDACAGRTPPWRSSTAMTIACSLSNAIRIATHLDAVSARCRALIVHASGYLAGDPDMAVADHRRHRDLPHASASSSASPVPLRTGRPALGGAGADAALALFLRSPRSSRSRPRRGAAPYASHGITTAQDAPARRDMRGDAAVGGEPGKLADRRRVLHVVVSRRGPGGRFAQSDPFSVPAIAFQSIHSPGRAIRVRSFRADSFRGAGRAIHWWFTRTTAIGGGRSQSTVLRRVAAFLTQPCMRRHRLA